jgi:hypothetical protein
MSLLLLSRGKNQREDFALLKIHSHSVVVKYNSEFSPVKIFIAGYRTQPMSNTGFYLFILQFNCDINDLRPMPSQPEIEKLDRHIGAKKN